MHAQGPKKTPDPSRHAPPGAVAHGIISQLACPASGGPRLLGQGPRDPWVLVVAIGWPVKNEIVADLASVLGQERG
eukprot:5980915-Pyramimonas_sp.AAC.1